jgi:signal transduction histidine kinase
MLDPGKPFTVALFAAAQEDHDLVAALLSQYQRSRFEVEVFRTADAARAALAERRHDVCLADAGLLSTDPTLFLAVAAAGRPLVVLADDDRPSHEEECLAAGACDCLVKFTLTPPVLARTLRRCIEHARLRALEGRQREAHKMEALARLAGGMAHDFNNLLTAMLGYAEMLRESLDPGDLRREDVMEIQRAGERASALTRQLLAFGRPSRVMAPSLDLNAALDRLESRLASTAGAGIAMSITRGSSLPPVRVDPARLETVLEALVRNARDAMPHGGRIRIESRALDLDDCHAAAHPGASPGPHVLLSVADEGTGMDAEVRSHLFEPFFTTKGKGKGTGLGLPVVYGIVHQAHGHIEVDSEVAKGTCVRIYWPAAPRDS